MKIAVVGLGYVGLPLAVSLAKHFSVIGFDIENKKIDSLKSGKDPNGEVNEISEIEFTSDPTLIKKANIIIVCVPTPIDDALQPNLNPLISAMHTIGENMAKNTTVVLESTVYPGVTEEICVPTLKKASGFNYPQDFTMGYSPERINPGDKERTINTITKVISATNLEKLDLLEQIYGKITKVYRAKTIKVAEAAKVIENIQRDLNISLMNELKIIFDKLNINTNQVLEAAQSKWNFHKYTPGLVGGHCIGVDPYYLTHIAEKNGHHPEVILAGRRINDTMHKFYAVKIVKRLKCQGTVCILGLTFKPDVSDFRNSRVKHLITELKQFGIKVQAYDPFVSKEITESFFDAEYVSLENITADLVVKAVNHKKMINIPAIALNDL